MRILGIIPARYGSTRFPGKPLAVIGGKTMIQRTWERAAQSSLDAVVVATDDQRIFDEVQGFGGQAVMTRPDHRSGTDRCREALDKMGDYDAVVNIQGDEPFIDPDHITHVADLLRLPDVHIATLAKPITIAESLFSSHCVKVVFGREGDALYFSRSPLPNVRGASSSEWLQAADFYQHIGIYGYRSETLREVSELPMGRLEQAEKLEQLRWLENGYRIRVGVVPACDSIAIDTPDDLLNIPQELL